MMYYMVIVQYQICIKEIIEYSNKHVFNDVLNGNKYSIKYILNKALNKVSHISTQNPQTSTLCVFIR